MKQALDRAVWSLWTRPLSEFYHSRWASDRFHLLSWVLSFHTVGAHFGSTALVTDNEGATLLIDRLRLPFDYVSTDLEVLQGSDPRWWVLGKLHAYSSQSRAFVHFDSDVYLWKPLPVDLLDADILTQNPEYASISDRTYYKPTAFTRFVQSNGGWLPPELLSYVKGGGGTAFCTGIVGGRNIEALRRYSERAIAIIEHPDNTSLWRSANIETYPVLVEQYYLGAFCADMTCELDRRLNVKCLFPSLEGAFQPAASAEAGFTHLIAGAKRNPVYQHLVAERVRRDYPTFYERVEQLSPSQ